MKKVDELLCRLLGGQLQSIGICTATPSIIAEQKAKSGLLPLYDRWLEESLTVLARNGYLSYDGQSCTVLDTTTVDMDQLWREWDQKKMAWLRDSSLKAHLVLVETTMRALPEILTGKVSATEIMFPHSSMKLVEGVYKNNPTSDYFNEVLANTVASYVRDRLKRDPSARIRIIEIGAGTGGTSAMVFQKLRSYRESIEEYCYTDLSQSFLLFAEKEYGSENPYLTYKRLNVEQPISGQGIREGGYDLVIAANVLHATKNIRHTLRNAKALLRNNGLLLLNEISMPSIFAHLTFGLLEGWWLYEDAGLRIPGSPGLSPETWKKVLKSEGFPSVLFPAQQAHDLGQQIIIAQSDGIVRQTKEQKTSTVHRKKQNRPEVQQAKPPAQKIASTDSEAISQDLLREKSIEYIKTVVGEVLKIPSHKIDSAEHLETYGVDSIITVQITNHLQEVFDDISSTLLFEYQTIDALTEHLMQTKQDALVKLVGLPQGNLDRQIVREKAIPVRRSPQRPDLSVRKAGQMHPLPTPRTNGSQPPRSREPIAIIGMSGRYPQAKNLDEYWENLKAGKDCITEIPEERWPLDGFYHPDPDEAVEQGKSYSKWGGFVEGFADFDPLFFHISPREAISIDPQERLFIQSCWEVLEDAGYTREQLAMQYNRRVGVFVGITKTGFDLYGPELWSQGEKLFPHTSFSSVANRISYLLDLQAPSMPIDTMCSSSLTAIHQACEHIYRGECEMAIAGGVNLYLHPSSYIGLCSRHMLSTTNRSAAFGKGGDGFVPGEGVGCVLLKPLSQAELDGDHIYAVIVGSQINHNGKTNGYMVSNPNAQTDLLLENFKKSGIDPRTISYVEAAAFGSNLGDAIEINALKKAFAQYTEDEHFCAIGSVKANLGHLEAASGMSQLTKVVWQLRNRELVPSIHAESLNPNICFENSPFYLSKERQEWKRPILTINGEEREIPRRATISSFGAGGTNAHLIVEEYIPVQEEQASTSPAARPQIIVLSARNADRLREIVRQILQFLEQREKISLPNLAYTLQVGREAMAFRLAIVASSREELIQELREYLGETVDNKKENAVPIFQGDKESNEEMNHLLSGQTGEMLVNILLEENRPEKLAQLWVQGVNIPWTSLYHSQSVRKIRLPTYPFEKQQYWIRAKMIDQQQLAPTTQTIPDEQWQKRAAADAKMFVKEILCSILELKMEEVQMDVPFSDYGMDSVILMDLYRNLKKHIPLLDVAALKQCVTLQEIVQLIEEQADEKTVRAMVARDDGEKPRYSKSMLSVGRRESPATVTQPEQDMEEQRQQILRRMTKLSKTAWHKRGLIGKGTTVPRFQTLDVMLDERNCIWIFFKTKVIGEQTAADILHLHTFIQQKVELEQVPILYFSHYGSHFLLGGDRLFFAESNLDEKGQEKFLEWFEACKPIFTDHLSENHPLRIAVCAGTAQGGGFEYLLSCDFQFVLPQIKLGVPEIKSNLYAGMGGLSYLASQVGLARAKLLNLTGGLIYGHQAHEMGLISHVTANPFTDAYDFYDVIPNIKLAKHLNYRLNQQYHELRNRDLNDWIQVTQTFVKEGYQHILDDYKMFKVER
ncbi:phosphopantetheine-binding protein [Brevibacillus humidisoli]|uniref:beta-ketoacyl synthase N-terminal-like domain-containing protein n=1 Tax=Brevibacillus humidisoli TaxID=2895522 RepID=UPI001E41185A|nr:beta-ketoacyl synthase N-terminal-like domain-containing protein [Brevibacillus humidisoli]UFJ41786.1 phosphopantetheine-binding protein [Brevibacillus humidisoli]